MLQQSRHPLNRPELYPGVPCVFDADDADFLNNPELVAECCRGSRATIAGSRFVANYFRKFSSDVSVVWTGTYLRPSLFQRRNSVRRSVIAWGHSDPFGYVAEADFVREVAVGLAKRRKFEFHLYGISEPGRANKYLGPFYEAGIEVRTFPKMRYGTFARSLEQAAVGLHPIAENHPFSKGKSFGKLLVYMVSNVAIVTDLAADHPLFFRDGRNGLMPVGVAGWINACDELLGRQRFREDLANSAAEGFRERLSTSQAAELVHRILLRAHP
jgi:hypothetical protein